MLDSVIEIGFSLETFDSSSVTQQPPEKGILSQQMSQQMSQQLSQSVTLSGPCLFMINGGDVLSFWTQL